MKALLSAQAGLAVVLGSQPQFRPVDGSPYDGSERDLPVALAGLSDIVEIEASDVNEVDRKLGEAWSLDRASYLLFALLDGGVGAALEEQLASEIDRLVTDYRIKRSLKKALAEIDLKGERLERAQALAEEFPAIAPFLAAIYPEVEASEDRVLVRIGDVAMSNDYAQGRKVHFVGRIALRSLSAASKAALKNAKAGPNSKQALVYERILKETIARAKQRLAQESGGRGRIKKQVTFQSRLGYVNGRALENVAAGARRELVQAISRAGVSASVPIPTRQEMANLIRDRQGVISMGLKSREDGRRVRHVRMTG